MNRPEEPPAAEAWLAWLVARQRFGIRPGLERTRELLRALGNPQEAFRSVLVGGTNGKGSTAAALAAALERGGRRSALFISPHLQRLEERFVVAGEPIARTRLGELVEAVRPHAEVCGATFFEVLTAVACLHFAAEGVELAVFEVGLGGRYDATNALTPELAILTGVSLDHTEVLGGTVAAIAADKSGILRRGAAVVTGATGEALAVIEAAATALAAPLYRLGHEISVAIERHSWEGLELRVAAGPDTLALRTPLLGRHQAANLALAAVAARLLGVTPEAIAASAATLRWPGRLERFRVENRFVVLDGAHNPAAAEALARALDELGPSRGTLLLGCSRERDPRALWRPLAGFAERVMATRARRFDRALSAAAVAAAMAAPMAAAMAAAGGDTKAGAVEIDEDPVRALERAVAATPEGGTVVATGSLYLIGELRAYLTGGLHEGYRRRQ